MAYRCELNSKILCLVGPVITLYDNNGRKVRQWFFDSKDNAKLVFMSLVG